MSRYGKWIGGGLGWALGGPIGGVLGFLFGSMFDSMQTAEFEYKPPVTGQSGEQQSPRSNWYARRQTQPGDFTISLLVLSAAVMKADQRVMKSELDYVKAFLVRQFGEEIAAQQALLLRDILKQEINVKEVAGQISRYMDYSSRLQLLHYLFGIVLADGQTPQAEVVLVEQIAGFIGISHADFTSIKAMFIKDNFNNYKILDLQPDATDEEVKKAYRKMALKYHPDRVAHLGPEVQHSAKEKFQQLNAAYNAIKAERGMN